MEALVLNNSSQQEVYKVRNKEKKTQIGNIHLRCRKKQKASKNYVTNYSYASLKYLVFSYFTNKEDCEFHF